MTRFWNKHNVWDNDKPRWANFAFPLILLLVAYCVNRWVQQPYTEWQNTRQQKGIKGCDDQLIQAVEEKCFALWCWEKQPARGLPERRGFPINLSLTLRSCQTRSRG